MSRKTENGRLGLLLANWRWKQASSSTNRTRAQRDRELADLSEALEVTARKNAIVKAYGAGTPEDATVDESSIDLPGPVHVLGERAVVRPGALLLATLALAEACVLNYRFHGMEGPSPAVGLAGAVAYRGTLMCAAIMWLWQVIEFVAWARGQWEAWRATDTAKETVEEAESAAEEALAEEHQLLLQIREIRLRKAKTLAERERGRELLAALRARNMDKAFGGAKRDAKREVDRLLEAMPNAQ